MPILGAAGGSSSGAAERLRLALCLARAAPGQRGRSPSSAAAGGPRGPGHLGSGWLKIGRPLKGGNDDGI